MKITAKVKLESEHWVIKSGTIWTVASVCVNEKSTALKIYRIISSENVVNLEINENLLKYFKVDFVSK